MIKSRHKTTEPEIINPMSESKNKKILKTKTIDKKVNFLLSKGDLFIK